MKNLICRFLTTRLIPIICLFFIYSCESDILETGYNSELGHDFKIDARLPVDSNGFFHLSLNMGSWQTLHRISGSVSPVEEDWALTKVYWSSSHYWIIGDTLGYIVHFNNPFNDTNYWYQTPDTSYITFFEGFEVPTINSASYSTNDGEINTMFAPVQNMLGDTITIWGQATFADGYASDELNIQIILD